MTDTSLDRTKALVILDGKALVAHARDGERPAFEELYRRYHSAVAGRLTRLLGPRPMVTDLVQETFAKAWQKLSSYPFDAPSSHWIPLEPPHRDHLARGDYWRQRRRSWTLGDRPEIQEEARDLATHTASYPELEIIQRGCAALVFEASHRVGGKLDRMELTPWCREGDGARDGAR